MACGHHSFQNRGWTSNWVPIDKKLGPEKYMAFLAHFVLQIVSLTGELNNTKSKTLGYSVKSAWKQHPVNPTIPTIVSAWLDIEGNKW